MSHKSHRVHRLSHGLLPFMASTASRKDSIASPIVDLWSRTA